MNRRLIATIAFLAAASSTSATTWNVEERLTSTATDSETGLNHTPLCVDSSGDLHVVWAEQDGARGNYQIYTLRRLSGIWQPPALVVPFRPESVGALLGAKFPSILCDESDTLHVAWHDYRHDGINNSEIYYKQALAGAAWDTAAAAETRLTTTSHPETNGDNGYVPTLRIERDGTLHVAWYDYRFNGGAAEVLYKRRVDGTWDTTPGDGPDLNISVTAGDSQFPAMVVDGWGNAHFAWHDDSAGNNRILYTMRDAVSGSVDAPVEITSHGLPAATPAIAVDGTGRVYLAWADSRDGSRRIYTRRKTAGGSWSPELPATPAGLSADEPSLAVDAFGQAHLAWHDTRVSALNREVFVQTTGADVDWDSTGALDFQVSNGSGQSVRPSIVTDAVGRVFVVWKDRRDGNNEIYFRQGQADAPVSTATNTDVPLPRLVATPNPFRRSTRLLFPGSPGTGRLWIVSASGRRVRQLTLTGGRSIEWDGNDDGGNRLPAGVYFLLPDGARKAAGRVVRVP